jgi:RNA polymerase sigma factor (sigma-70 family)
VSPKISIRLLAVQSDRRLLDLVAGGYERAFEVLVQRYRGELLRYCRRLGLSEARSEDAVQHALLKAWLALERGEEVRAPRAWLYRIAHNTAINIVRAPEDHRPLADADSVESTAGVETDLERALEVRDALTDVAALPPMQREAILLTALDGRSHEEVASALGITDGAVRGLIYRARTTLRAAAAALTPQPLVAWFCGAAAKVAPTTQRLAEISAQGSAGADASGPLFKGAALAVTAVVLAAGAADVPLHRHASHRAKAFSSPAHTAREVAAAVPVASVGGQRATHALSSRASAARAAKRAGARGHPGVSRHKQHDGRSDLGRHDLYRSSTRAEPGDGSTQDASSGEGRAAQSAPSATLANSKGRDGGHDGSDGSGSSTPGPGGSTTSQPVSSSGDGSRGAIATTTGSESSGQSDPGSGNSSAGRR